MKIEEFEQVLTDTYTIGEIWRIPICGTGSAWNEGTRMGLSGRPLWI